MLLCFILFCSFNVSYTFRYNFEHLFQTHFKTLKCCSLKINFISNKFLTINVIGLFGIAFLIVLFLTFIESSFSARGLRFPPHPTPVSFLLFSILKLCTSWRIISLRYVWASESWVTQSCPTLCVSMDCAHQSALSMEFSR